MSAETLREAAALMRGRAGDATAGSWQALVDGVYVGAEYDDHGWLSYDSLVIEDRDNEDPEPSANVEHIASWHPAVALAVADWLDAEAKALEFDTGVGLTYDEAMSGMGYPALAVARAYLGEDA